MDQSSRTAVLAALSVVIFFLAACGSGSQGDSPIGGTADSKNLEGDPPATTVGILLADGNDIHNSLTVPYVLTPPENATTAVVTDTPDFSKKAPVPLVLAGEWTFPKDGKHSLYVIFFDDEGAVIGSYVDSITIDLFAGATLAIYFLGPVSKSWLVPLELELPPNAERLQLDENEDFTGARWIEIGALPEQYEFAGSGRHTLFLRVQDGNGYISQPVKADILVEPFGPNEGGITAEEGADQTTKTTISLTLNLPETAVEMKVYRTGGEAAASWIPARPTATLTTNQGGLNTFYARFRDGEGNTSREFSDGIFVELFPLSNLDFQLANSTTAGSLTLQLTSIAAPSEAFEMRLSHRQSFKGVGWQSFATNGTVTIPYCQPDVPIFMQIRDQAGFTSQTFTKTVTVSDCGALPGPSCDELADEVYMLNIAPATEGSCQGCHGGAGNRIQFTVGDSAGNRDDLYRYSGGSADRLIGKMDGSIGHGGGVQSILTAAKVSTWYAAEALCR